MQNNRRLLKRRHKSGDVIRIMLIGEVMERTPYVTAAENTANRLADRVRNIWLRNMGTGITEWEENFYEDPDGVFFLREEDFPALQAIDYLFKWWNGEDVDTLAGELEVLWKVRRGGGIQIYKTVIRFAQRDFIRGNILEERRKREANRAEFREAFATWHKLYLEMLGTD